MRTAKNIADGYTRLLDVGDHALWVTEKDFIAAINSAREEAIKECSEVAKSEWVRWGEHMGHQVEKKSILDLLNQLK